MLTANHQFDNTYVEHSPVELSVKGYIPPWAAGTLFRTGTSVSDISTDKGTTFKVSHWFDAFAIVHRFQILPPEREHAPVRVIYNSRSTCDGLIKKIQKTGKADNFTFGRKYDPCKSYFKKVMAVFLPQTREPASAPDQRSMAVTMRVNVPGLSPTGKNQPDGAHESGKVNSLCNMTDANGFQMLNPETLEPIGLANQTVLHPELKGPLSSAHSETDPATGDFFNFNLDFGTQPVYRIFRISGTTGKTDILARIPTEPAYLHSFFLTKNYVILCVWNSYFAHNGASILWKQNIVDALKDFDSSKPTRWFVVDRRSPAEGGQGVIATYESDAFYCFHTINAFEEKTSSGGVDIVADLLPYSSLDIIKTFYVRNMVSSSPEAIKFHSNPANIEAIQPKFARFRLASIPSAPTAKPLKAVRLGNPPSQEGKKTFYPELPTINPNFKFHRHRYVYGVADTGKSTFQDTLVKYDVDTGKTLEWSQHGQTAGEAIFVPRLKIDHSSAATADSIGDEEDGVLLTVVLDGPAGRSYLLALDPKTMTETGRAELAGPLGFGFHSTHVA